MRVVLSVDGGAPGRLLNAALPLVSTGATWVPVHVIDTRGRVDLGLLRSGVPGSGSLGANQRALIETAGRERARIVVEAAEAALEAQALLRERSRIEVGEPGRVICALAGEIQADLVVLFARRHGGGPLTGPPSVGHTARFVVDHAPCPVLLLRGT
jgi:nucleotide-binding universal stress UspA family protein